MNTEFVKDVASFLNQLGQEIEVLDQHLRKDAETARRCQELARQTAQKLAGVGLIAREEIPEWENDLSSKPDQALKTLQDMCEILQRVSKQAQQTRKEKAVEKALNPGRPVNHEKQAGWENGSTNGNHLPQSVKVLLESAARLK